MSLREGPPSAHGRLPAAVQSSTPRRRQWLQGLCSLPLWGCATQGLRTEPTPGDGALSAQWVAAGVYVIRGRPGELGAATQGRGGNIGVIVGREGVWVVNSGGSHRHGQAALSVIQRLTPLPIRGVVLTHALQEFVFGATAFQDLGIPVWMHRQAARLMASRCEACLRSLVREVGEETMQGTRVPKPDVLLGDSLPTSALPHQLPQLGRSVQLLNASLDPQGATAASPGDVAVLDEASQTLFTGALLETDTIVDIQDADMTAWKASLARWSPQAPRTVVAGHGASAPGALAIQRTAQYLQQLELRTTERWRQGVSLSNIAEAVSLPDFAHWARHDSTHRRNVTLVYLRLEREQLLQSPATSAPTRSRSAP